MIFFSKNAHKFRPDKLRQTVCIKCKIKFMYYPQGRFDRKFCSEKCQHDFASKNKQSIEEKKEKANRWRLNNKESVRKVKQEWYIRKCQNNPVYKAHRKEYAKKNLEGTRIRDRLRYQKNENFRMLKILRAQVRYSLTRGFKLGEKCAPTLELLDIPSIQWFWDYIEKQFKPGMTRQNQGTWHIDHIKPCSSFDLSDPRQQRECFHYTNLQPLWALDNIRKKDKIISGDITSPKM